MLEILLLMATIEFSSIEMVVSPDFVIVFDQSVIIRVENSSKIPEVRETLDIPASHTDAVFDARFRTLAC